MSRTFTTIVIVTVTMLTTASPAKSDETEVPGGFLVIPAVVLGATDFFFFLGNMVDVRNDQASRARGALAVVFGTATVLTAVGVPGFGPSQKRIPTRTFHFRRSSQVTASGSQ